MWECMKLWKWMKCASVAWKPDIQAEANLSGSERGVEVCEDKRCSMEVCEGVGVCEGVEYVKVWSVKVDDV